jgi:hypothetical protein
VSRKAAPVLTATNHPIPASDLTASPPHALVPNSQDRYSPGKRNQVQYSVHCRYSRRPCSRGCRSHLARSAAQVHTAKTVNVPVKDVNLRMMIASLRRQILAPIQPRETQSGPVQRPLPLQSPPLQPWVSQSSPSHSPAVTQSMQWSRLQGQKVRRRSMCQERLHRT